MTDTLTITPDMVGKYVRLRSGRKAYIAVIINSLKVAFPVLGAYMDAESHWTTIDSTWSINGEFYLCEKSYGDIISLWEEEEPKCEGSDAISKAIQNYNSIVVKDFEFLARRIKALEEHWKALENSLK